MLQALGLGLEERPMVLASSQATANLQVEIKVHHHRCGSGSATWQ